MDSSEGNGATVQIKIKREYAPAWFIDVIKLNKNDMIVIVDDDETIHHIWAEKFKKLSFDIDRLVHFYSPEDFSNWLNIEGNLNNTQVFLFDHNFIKSEKTGLQYIKELNISHKSILVTNDYDLDDVINQCESSNIKLIPKNIVKNICLAVSNEIIYKNVTHILIDDNDLTHEAWELIANVKGIKFLSFSNHKTFFEIKERFSLDLTIYIDSNLHNGVKGIDVAKELYDYGFKNLFLATATPKSHFEPLPYWIRDVLGKKAPW